MQCLKTNNNEFLPIIPQQLIGRPRMIDEIDEPVMAKRKYNRGRMTSEICFFGGICRQTGERFIFQAPERSSDYLDRFTKVYITEESIIHSNGKLSMRSISCPKSTSILL